MERINPSSSLGKLLDWCTRKEATDLHCQADRRYSYRVDGQLRRIPPDEFATPTNDEIAGTRIPRLRVAQAQATRNRLHIGTLIDNPAAAEVQYLNSR